MIRIKLVIADNDENYISRLSNVFNAKYSDKLEVYSFTNLNPLMDFIKNNKVDVLLACESIGLEQAFIPERVEFAYFVDAQDIESLNNRKAVCKFQKVDLIYKAVLNLYSENPANVIGFKQGGNGETTILSFFSPSGGTGKSTVSAACCMNLAMKGKKVLYINLEQFGTPSIFFNAEGSFNLSDIIYAIKSKKTNIALKLESSVKNDNSGVYFFDECKTALDLIELTGNDLKKLIEELKKGSFYDYIVMDGDMTINDTVINAMQYSHRLIFVSDGSEVSNLKFVRLHKALGIIESQKSLSLIPKISILYNKFNSSTSKYISDIPDINILGGIGEYSRSSSLQIARQISQLQIFDNIC